MSMIPTLMDKRPPFIQFRDQEYGINRDASEAAGRPVPAMVTMACITPHGSKDEFIKPAEEWLAQTKAKALRGDYPVEWYNHFDLQFTEWKKGNELPREGTPIQTWQAVSNEQRSRLKAIGIPTVEDLAQFPDSSLAMVGLDGRYLRDLARGWLDEGKDKGINAKALADANAKIADQQVVIDRQEARLAALEARLDDEKPKRQRA
jgi:hypothetical protein